MGDCPDIYSTTYEINISAIILEWMLPIFWKMIEEMFTRYYIDTGGLPVVKCLNGGVNSFTFQVKQKPLIKPEANRDDRKLEVIRLDSTQQKGNVRPV